MINPTNFNPRTRVGCDAASFSGNVDHADFNPRTRVGCDRDNPQSVCRRGISIHAPAWGATIDFNPYSYQAVFQSTHPRGVRHFTISSISAGKDISIHAPAWGATKCMHIHFFVFGISIHAPAWGATKSRPKQALSNYHFNPRTRVGCDYSYPLTPCGDDISIHAPAWGATVTDKIYTHVEIISIHAPAWGATGDNHDESIRD